jgi:hypothetical protein
MFTAMSYIVKDFFWHFKVRMSNIYKSKIYKFVTMIYYYNYHNSGSINDPILHKKNTTFQRLDSVSAFRWNLLSRAQ